MKDLIVIIDGAMMTSKEDAHNYLKRKLNFPEYYGHNLDALNDMLAEMADVHFVMYRHDIMVEKLGAYGESLLEVFEEAVSEHKNFISMSYDNE